MTKEESDLIITEQNKSTEEILKAVAKVKSDYHELCKLKDKRIAELEDKLANADYQLEGRDVKIKELEAQIEKMKRCEICKHYRWNHCSYEINISEDCIRNKLKHFELKEIKEK